MLVAARPLAAVATALRLRTVVLLYAVVSMLLLVQGPLPLVDRAVLPL